MSASDPHKDAEIHPGASVGHVNLKVSDIDRALTFWRDALGFHVNQRAPGSAFLAAGTYHNHIALDTWESLGGAPPPPGTTGLYHVAIRYPERAALADAFRRLRAADIDLEGAFDHGVSESLYARDPDGNGVELYWDRPETEWPRAADGTITMSMRPMDPAQFLLDTSGVIRSG
jgi:catechol 2,3-dioxygenase